MDEIIKEAKGADRGYKRETSKNNLPMISNNIRRQRQFT